MDIRDDVRLRIELDRSVGNALVVVSNALSTLEENKWETHNSMLEELLISMFEYWVEGEFVRVQSYVRLLRKANSRSAFGALVQLEKLFKLPRTIFPDTSRSVRFIQKGLRDAAEQVYFDKPTLSPCHRAVEITICYERLD